MGCEEISSDWPKIFASGTPYLNKKDSEEKVILETVAKRGRVILFPPYVLALHHVVDVQVFEDIYLTPWGPKTAPAKADGVLEEKYWLQESKNSSKKIPLEKILVETDRPFVAPVPYRGKRNEPVYVKYVAQKIAELRGLSFDEVAEQTIKNAKKLFKI